MTAGNLILALFTGVALGLETFALAFGAFALGLTTFVFGLVVFFGIF
jgi:hypothetical protein